MIGKIENNRKNKFLNYTSSFLLAAILMYFALKEVDFKEVIKELKNVRIGYILIALGTYYLSLLARAEKWRIQVENLGYKLSSFKTFWVMVYHYFFNSFTVKLGAVARCTILLRENVSMSKCLGTFISEMIYDIFFLIIATIVMLVVEYKKVIPIFSGFKTNVDIYLSQRWKNLLIVFISIIILVFIIYFISKKFLKNTKFGKWVLDKIKSFSFAVKSTFKLQKFPLFIAWNGVLWILLFFMNFYLARALNIPIISIGFIIAITVFTYYGWLIPTPGGIGSVEYFVLQSFLLFALSRHSAIVYGLMSNTLTLFGILFLGLFGILFMKKKIFGISKE